MPLEHEIKKIDVGLNHCVAFSKCGLHVYTWGRGTEGQLGVGFYKSRPDPLVISQFKGLIVDVSAGFNHSAAITSEGLLYVWGKGMATVLKNSSTKGTYKCGGFFLLL